MAVLAGMKRPYQQFQDHDGGPVSAPSSREASPLRRQLLDGLEAQGLRSGFQTPSGNWTDQNREAAFNQRASIVLVGIKGTGKSSLAIIAATAYNRQLVDTERAFLDAAGATAPTYRKLHGIVEYRKKHRAVLQSTLDAYSTDCVIVCGFHDLEDEGATILRTFADNHAVIHVTRDAVGIHSYLRVWPMHRVHQILRASGPLLRSCANYEFYNLTETLADREAQKTEAVSKSGGLFLTLKRVERDFLKLLRNILGDHERTRSHHSAYPLSKIAVHQRNFTLCSRIGVEEVLNNSIDLNDAQVGVDAIELVVKPMPNIASPQIVPGEDDLLKTAEAFAMVRRATIVPLMLTAESDRSDDTSVELMENLTSYCLRLAPEYCTIALDSSDAKVSSWTKNKGRTLVIGCFHKQQSPAQGWNDPLWLSTYERADTLGCDVVRLTMRAQAMVDNFSVHGLIQKADLTKRSARLTAYNTGKEGRLSKCVNRLLTPVRPSRDHKQLNERSEDDLTAKDVFMALFATFVCEPMQFYIYGANVSYSLSPAMHNAAYSACGMGHAYSTYSSSSLDDLKKLCRMQDFGGAAVVQPYKTGVVPLLDGMSSHAHAIGSVNTVLPIRVLSADGTLPDQMGMLTQMNRTGPVRALYGDNTDWIGIRACLRRGLSPANTVRPQSTALVCGAGGQARSAIYALLSLGVRNIFVCNRTLGNAQTLAEHYNKLIEAHAISELDSANASQCQVRVLESFTSPWPNDFRAPSMIVSSIPTQTADGSPTNFRLPDEWLRSPNGGVVIELAYRPMITPIVTQMRESSRTSWVFMDGFDVLPEQAFAQFELFTGRRAPRQLMRDEVLKRYREEQQNLIASRSIDPNPMGT